MKTQILAMGLTLADCFYGSLAAEEISLEPNNLAVHLTVEKNDLQLGAPINIKILVENLGDTPMTLFHTGPAANFSVFVFSSNGEAIKKTETGKKIFPYSVGEGEFVMNSDFNVSPKATKEIGRLNLMHIFDLKESGLYFAVVIYSTATTFPSEWTGTASSIAVPFRLRKE